MLSSYNGVAMIKGSLRLSVIACVVAAAVAGRASADTGTRAIERTYHQLVHELSLSHGVPPDEAVRRNVTTAAQEFQNAMRRDGGARPELASDAKNIIASLKDGSFSADKSVDALRRDSRGSVIDAGAWNPASLAGTPVPATIGTHLNQTSSGDCVGVSVVKAFSNTRMGAEILSKTVTQAANGSYNVNLPGDPATVYHVDPGGLENIGKGDPAAAAVITAMFRYFHLDPKTQALPTNKVMELLAGTAGSHARLADAETTPEGITRFLLGNAAAAGSSVAIVFGGRPGPKGVWSRGDGHAFAIIHIDASSGIVAYTNPWNQDDVHTIAVADLARQAAGTPADFETVSFR